jgi:hypothetical protein
LGRGIATVDGIQVNSTEEDARRSHGTRLSTLPENPQVGPLICRDLTHQVRFVRKCRKYC